jgi:hypothetical protein
MADKPDEKPAAAAEQKSVVQSELIPSQADRVSGIGSLGAPFVYTDWIGSHGHNGGVATFTLEALRYMSVGDQTVRDRVVVAHLRMPLHTMLALKHSIEQVELLLKPPASEEKN